MKLHHKALGLQLYLFLSALFVAALITCNLIANKFIEVDLGFKVFVLSAGVLPYPLTFLFTDILSEIYGQRQANRVVWLGFAASVLVLGILWLGGLFDAIPLSPVSNEQYNAMFGNSWRVIAASMTAYLVAQLVDVRIFHFWKRLTKGKHLWLRNNGSTMVSQLVDTTLVVVVLFYGTMESGRMIDLIFDGWLFKAMVALLDTPVFYIASYVLKRQLALGENEEMVLD